MKRFEVKRVGDFWVPAEPQLENLARFRHDDVSSFDQIRAYLWVAVEAAYPGVYALDWPMPQLRAEAFTKIDARSDALIGAGFVFEGLVFSLTTEAQIRYATMMMLADMMPYPLGINSLDDNGIVQLQSPDHTRAFCLTAMAYVKGAVDSGTVEKDRVRGAETIEALMTFEDARPLPSRATPPP